ncbi:citrate synthase family protein [Marinibaculum pumilum]|uniref:citrate synthase (unknown stereospecificity) n=1 Tax=Marinibaculum pumilum TaxID=1766165 RepID=A0ABV7L9L9_9PROT
MTELDYMTAREAAALLGVGRATLYAYVSRGLIRSEPFGGGRQKRYLRRDIDTLVRRRQGQPSPAGGAAGSDGGLLLPSAITLIADGRLSYRGHDAVALSEGLGLEETARLLWQVQDWDPFADLPARSGMTLPVASELPPLARLMASLPLAEAVDPQAVNHSRQGCARTGARLLVHARDVMLPAAAGSAARLHEALASGWGLAPGGADLVRRCLVLCADHEFNASAFAARCVAGTGASVYAAVTAALAALRGPRHGGATARVAAMLEELRLPDGGGQEGDGTDRGAAIAAAVSARLARGDDMPGFGHPLYSDRDPRAAALLRALARHAPDDPARRDLALVVEAARRLSDRHPNIDFALVAVARVLGLPAEAPVIIFALGRIAGWVAHIEEQYRDGRLVRPRSVYTGPPPK